METAPSYVVLILGQNLSSRFIWDYFSMRRNTDVKYAHCIDRALEILDSQVIDLVVVELVERADLEFVRKVCSLPKSIKPFLTVLSEKEPVRENPWLFDNNDILFLPSGIEDFQLASCIAARIEFSDFKRQFESEVREKAKQLTDDLKKAKECAEIANEAKTTFLTYMSHELRTPLNILLSINQLLQLYLTKFKTLDREKIKEKLALQMQNCYRLMKLVNNLIDISKIESGNYSLNTNYCDIVDFIRMVTNSVEEYAKNKGISLFFNTSVKEKLLSCDIDAVERILLNLLSNAIKFTPRGGRVRVSVKDRNDYITISIADNGVGIPKDKMDIIFEKYKQVDTCLNTEKEGSGLGLTIVKSLVEMHKGTIQIKSDYGKGCKFIVRLPCSLKETVYESATNLYQTKESSNPRLFVELSDLDLNP